MKGERKFHAYRIQLYMYHDDSLMLQKSAAGYELYYLQAAAYWLPSFALDLQPCLEFGMRCMQEMVKTSKLMGLFYFLQYPFK